MTCIVGLVDNGDIWIGGDSAGVNTALQLSILKQPKVFIKDSIIYGYTSSFYMGQLIQYSLCRPEGIDSFEPDVYLATKLIPEFKKLFELNHYAKVEHNIHTGGFFLVGFKSRLFKIQQDYSFNETHIPYMATGCGEDVSLGSMHATLLLPPRNRVYTALSAAQAHYAGVKEPFTIIKLEKDTQ